MSAGCFSRENTGKQPAGGTAGAIRDIQHKHGNNSRNSNRDNSKNSSRNGNVRRTITVEATAYTGSAEENGGWANMTSTGAVPREGRTIAVDPRVIPYGTRVYIPALGGTYVAEDCGGAIKGNRIDIFMNTSSKCNAWGRRHIEVQILE